VTIVVLLILAVVWAIVLVPPALRARQEGRPAESISHFRRQLFTLQRTGPWSRPAPSLAGLHAVPSPAVLQARANARGMHQTRAQKRRRDIFVGLLAAMGISLVLGLIPALRILWLVHLLADMLFIGYVALLVRMRNDAAEREMKVSFLPGPAPQVEPALLLRRSAN
jgi:hypothetical protein